MALGGFEMAVLGLALAVTVSTLLVLFWVGAPPVSATTKEQDAIVDSLKRFDMHVRIYELGAGWGALAKRLGQTFPMAEVIAFELSPLPWLVAALRCRGLGNVSVRFGDFRRSDLAGAGAVVCYLARAPMRGVAALLDNTLVHGTPVVSLCFWFRDRAREQSVRGTPLGGEAALYLWPAHKSEQSETRGTVADRRS